MWTFRSSQYKVYITSENYKMRSVKDACGYHCPGLLSCRCFKSSPLRIGRKWVHCTRIYLHMLLHPFMHGISFVLCSRRNAVILLGFLCRDRMPEDDQGLNDCKSSLPSTFLGCWQVSYHNEIFSSAVEWIDAKWLEKRDRTRKDSVSLHL